MSDPSRPAAIIALATARVRKEGPAPTTARHGCFQSGAVAGGSRAVDEDVEGGVCRDGPFHGRDIFDIQEKGLRRHALS